MTVNPTSASKETTVAEAIAILDEIGKRHLVIVDDFNKVLGIISERDLAPFALARLGLVNCTEADVMLDSKVTGLMQENFISAYADDEVTKGIDLMINHKIGALPIVHPETNVLEGILSYTDVLKAAKPFFKD